MPTNRPFRRTFTGRLVPTVVLCGFAFAGALADDLPAPQPSEVIHQIDTRSEKLEIRSDQTVVLEFPDWVTSVKSLNPSIVHVSAVRPDCLRIRRIGEGLAMLHVVDRHAREYSIEMTVVSPDAGHK
jgi:hypothetical protein